MKVFGIGMQRTATSSLNEALCTLGIRSFHGPYHLLENLDCDAMYPGFSGFTDNPIPLLYRQLDERYPGSRFILTRRDEDAWLDSVEWLFKTGSVKFGWVRGDKEDRVHAALYGTTTFERMRFRQIYREHNAGVEAYFSDRPADLHVFDLEGNNDWPQLCRFLDVSIPQEPFPFVNQKQSLARVRTAQWRDRMHDGYHAARTGAINLAKRCLGRPVPRER